jgi:hypothetical protein
MPHSISPSYDIFCSAVASHGHLVGNRYGEKKGRFKLFHSICQYNTRRCFKKVTHYHATELLQYKTALRFFTKQIPTYFTPPYSVLTFGNGTVSAGMQWGGKNESQTHGHTQINKNYTQADGKTSWI